jgi:uncharacterized protein
VPVLRTIALTALCFATAAGAQTPWQANAVPVATQQPFTFTNAGTKLAGTLYLPDHGDHVPAVVVFWGAQGPTRDYALYKQLADGLPAIGVAVLVFDRRGSGESGGSADADFDVLASDGIAALHALQHHARIDPKRVGFWGLSQGGWLSILAASKTPDAAFAVACSAPLVTPTDQMTFAVTNLFTVRNYGDTALTHVLALRRMEAAFMAGHVSRTAMIDSMRPATAQPWFKDAFLRNVDELTRTTIPDTAWLHVMNYDPIGPLETVRVPLLLFYGAADPWVPVAQTIDRLKPIAARHPNMSYYVIPNADHMLAFPAKQTMDYDTKTLLESRSESTEYFFVMASWLTRRLGLDPAPAAPAARPAAGG